MKKTVLAFGEVLWDILPSCTVLGGAPFNFAYRVNSLGDIGLMISRLGRDELGQKAFDKVVLLGLDTGFLQWDDHLPTGTVQVSFDEENNPDYVIIPQVAYDRIELTNGLLEAASSADCLCFGTLSQRAEKSRRTIEQLLESSQKGLKFLDVNLRKKCYSLKTVTFSLRKADVLKLNEQEAHQLGEMLGLSRRNLPEFCEEMLNEWSLRHCLVTLGEEGVVAMSAEGDRVYVPGYKIKLADSLGSGDAFSAGFVYQILRGECLAAACKFGNALGAIVATQTGATCPIEQTEVDSYLNNTFERIVYPELESFLAR
jgi:fructokinase